MYTTISLLYYHYAGHLRYNTMSQIAKLLLSLWVLMLPYDALHYATTMISYGSLTLVLCYHYYTLCYLSTILELHYAFTPYATTTLHYHLDMLSLHNATTLYIYSVLLQL